ncbi:hypothetical protein CKO09_11335 [Chromatium weissei]|nr:hypothetical protein [Chromatium weissei]
MNYHILPVTAFQQNCTLFWCERTRRAAIIDPGGEPTRILAFIAEQKLQPEHLLLTHGHLDHVGASVAVATALALPITGPHRDDSFLLDTLLTQSQMFGFPPVAAFTPERWLNHGDTLTFGDEQLEVLHCPGHTPGHVVFVNTRARLAQVGDVLFRGAIGRTDLPRGNHRQLLDSIQHQLLPLGDDLRFISGHGAMSTIGHERRTNPFIASKP